MTTPTDNTAYAFRVTLSLPFAEAMDRVTAALQAEGFGILTTIDVQATFQAKLGIAFDKYTILGACNPPLAHQALSAAPETGLLLPCNVVVRTVADGTLIEIADPQVMLGLIPAAGVQAVAHEARERLLRVAQALRSSQ